LVQRQGLRQQISALLLFPKNKFFFLQLPTERSLPLSLSSYHRRRRKSFHLCLHLPAGGTSLFSPPSVPDAVTGELIPPAPSPVPRLDYTSTSRGAFCFPSTVFSLLSAWEKSHLSATAATSPLGFVVASDFVSSPRISSSILFSV
jgi:hypothetical protein